MNSNEKQTQQAEAFDAWLTSQTDDVQAQVLVHKGTLQACCIGLGDQGAKALLAELYGFILVTAGGTALSTTLSPDQELRLDEALSEVCRDSGFGSVTITVEKGHPSLIQMTRSQKLNVA